MLRTLKYKGYIITIAPTTVEDWKGRLGYRATVVKPGFREVVSAQNFPNATKAGLVVKEAIDEDKIPQERAGLIGVVRQLLHV